MKKSGGAGGEPADRGAVAEDHDLARVLDRPIAAPVDLAQEEVHAGEALNVARLAPDHGALLDGLGGEESVAPRTYRCGDNGGSGLTQTA